jgi:hypothetical protein
MKKLTKPSLVIKLNANAIPTNCPLCGNPTNPNIGAELMIEGTTEIVCRSCGYEHAPHLIAILNLGESARFFTNSEDDFGVMQTAFKSNVIRFKEAA